MKKFTAETPVTCEKTVNGLIAEIEALPIMSWSELDAEKTAIFVIDVVNGFIKEGAMAAPSIAEIIPPIAELMKKANAVEMPVLAFADCHKENCAEFASFPPHCVEKTSECEIVDELKKVSGYFLLNKNSTNGFHEKEFMQCLIQNPQTNTFVITGDCTDICVLQLCLSLKTWYTGQNRKVNIIIPVDCVDTFDSPTHSADFMNIAAYKILCDSGIKFVRSIT